MDVKEHPELLIQSCDCGLPGCDTFVIAIIRPSIKPLTEHPEELVALAHVPIRHSQKIIDLITTLALEKGVRTRCSSSKRAKGAKEPLP